MKTAKICPHYQTQLIESLVNSYGHDGNSERCTFEEFVIEYIQALKDQNQGNDRVDEFASDQEILQDWLNSEYDRIAAAS